MDTPILEKARQRVALGELDEADNWSLDFAREVVRLRDLIGRLRDTVAAVRGGDADFLVGLLVMLDEADVDEGQLEHGPVLTKEMVREYLAADRNARNLDAFEDATAQKMRATLEKTRRALEEAVR